MRAAHTKVAGRISGAVMLLLASLVVATGDSLAGEAEDSRLRVEILEKELAETPEELAEAIAQNQVAMQPAPPEEEAKPKESPIRIGGTFGVNYAYGDYAGDSRRGSGTGDVDLEVFRLDADLDHDTVIGRVEYRFYDDSSMMHTAWLGYQSEQFGTVKAGIVRVPFGPGPYGVSSSWFFDQHYYVGLIDDMDLGIRWTRSHGELTVDLAYFLQDEGHWDGESRDSARYSYDPVTWDEHVGPDGEVDYGAGENGFEEDGQLNLRAVYAIDGGQLGASIQYGWLEGKNIDESGADHFAASVHGTGSFGDFKLVSQLSHYRYDITDDTPWGTGDLIPMGAFDFAWPVASEGWIPALSLRYNGVDTSHLSWLESVTPYVEWSSILKERDDFNDSSMWTAGALWYWGGLYVCTEVAMSDGNFFVGNKGDSYGNLYDGVGDLGANGNDKWNARFNVNARHYFDLFK
ncbi:MAG: hypothetical protein J4F97_02775 [Pseudomonadales bacterium]|nr:hypothetical protein [Pseudomonadales bacterium]